jgi:hypothetical protein
MHFTSKQVVIAIASVLAAACSGGKSGDSSKINGPGSTYRGAFADKNSTGSMTVTVASTSVSQSFSLPTGVAAQASAGPAANGSLVLLSGATVSLGGSFVASSGALSLSGGGYTFTGTLASGAISGTVGGPNGSGQFSVQPSSSSSGSEAKTYCGTYATNRDDGWFNLVTSSGGNVSGFVVATIGATSVGVIGTITGSALTATTQDGAPIQATLSPDGTTLTGSYLPVGTAAGLGTFQGSTASCMPGSATGLWTTNGPSGSGVILDQMHFAILLSGSSVTGSGGMNTSGSNVNGGLFTITSGAISSSTISITGPLGSNPDGNGGFYHGVLTFNGTFTTPTKMTGTLDYTGPRTVAGHPQPQTVMGVTLTRY